MALEKTFGLERLVAASACATQLRQVRLAQDFSMRYMLVDGHGNFGSVEYFPGFIS